MPRRTLGSARVPPRFGYGAITPFGRPSQAVRLRFDNPTPRPEPHPKVVWAPPLSLAATDGIDVSFSSSGYLDVSVPRVPFS